MNKPLAFICLCIAGVGLLILSRSIYCTIVYGRGNFEAGNFHRCVYTTETDPENGAVRRTWVTRWDLVSSTEGSPLAEFLNMWLLGIAMVVLGPALYVADWSRQGQRHSF
jgi:hypothetical protein